MRIIAIVRLATAASLLTFSAAACSDEDEDIPVAPTPDLVAPTGLAVTTTQTGATLTWTAVPTATGYIVQRAPGASGGTFVQVGDVVTGTAFTDAALTAATDYRYRVGAVRTSATGPFSGELAARTQAVTPTGPRIRRVTGDITASQTWSTDSTYVLGGFVKVRNGATLTIQPGVTVVGDTAVPGSSLWILRGARINAVGTATQPIVFTSQRPSGSRAPGDWGGLILIGNGIINRTGATITTEGGQAGVAENYAGGTDNNDNSGTLRYVRIEFAGFDVSNGGGQELNALSMYAVGRGTTIEYVQTLSGLDDSFEWWGGAVDARYLVSYESGDDHFDWTEGYVGRNQFLIALQTQRLVPRTGAGVFSTDPRGFEGDGCDPGVSGCVVTATGVSTPYSMPVFANFTLVGTGVIGGFPADGNGATIRRGSGGTFRNGVLARWRGIGLNIRDAFTDSLRVRDSLSIRGLVLAENFSNFDTTGAGNNGLGTAEKFATSNVRTAAAAAALFTSLNPTALDWRPIAGATNPLTSGAEATPAARVAGYFSTSGGWQNTTFIGAVEPGASAPWYSGWTRYSIN